MYRSLDIFRCLSLSLKRTQPLVSRGEGLGLFLVLRQNASQDVNIVALKSRRADVFY